MIDIVLWPLKQIWYLIVWVCTEIIQIVIWIVETIVGIAIYFVKDIAVVFVATLFDLYEKAIIEYPGVSMAICPIAWLVQRQWVVYNERHNIIPKNVWSMPTFVVVVGTPIVIAIIAAIIQGRATAGGISVTLFVIELNNPFIVISFSIFILFSIYTLLLKLDVLKKSSEPDILKLLMHYSFVITLITVVCGFGLAGYQTYKA
jgi:hypothetical protein